MLKVYKFDIDYQKSPSTILSLPEGAEVLCVQAQGEVEIKLWALLDPSLKMELRKFIIYGTGHEINIPPEKLEYIGSVQTHAGAFIWHVFEIKEDQ